MGVNLMGVVHGVRAFVPRMLAGGNEGHIVNTASVAGLLTGSGPYFASKHGVACLTEGLYKDLKSAGSKLSASLLCPGVIRTGILDAERNRLADMGPATDVSALSETSQRWAADFRAQLEAGYEPATRMRDIVEQRNPTLAPAAS